MTKRGKDVSDVAMHIRVRSEHPNLLARCSCRLAVKTPMYPLTGVHHLYFYLPNLPGNSRVLARLQRRWMPPSSTWLFPPRWGVV